jgi:TolA-binding protein
MRMKSALLVSAGVGVLIAAGVGSAAEAKTHHHHHASDGGSSALKSQVDSLTAAVSELENRLNDTTQQLQATQARAAAAEAAAQSAQADIQATRAQVDEQVQTIPGVVSTAIAANKPKPTWADGTKVGGQVFADLSYINQTPKPNKINGVGADIKRAYITVDHRFSDIYSADLTIDFAPNGIILKCRRICHPVGRREDAVDSLRR